MVWYDLVRPLLFKLPAEAAHQLAFTLIKAGERLGFWTKRPPSCNPISLWGLTFPHRLGLAAGLDKNGELLPFWAHLGFAFVEVGTVTPRPQPGNPKPRLFRIPKDYALLNRMGFNNAGAVQVAQNLEKRPPGLIVGINIGKNKETPLEEAHKDYKQAFEILYSYGDFFVVNVSSPNTPGLRSLQSPESLNAIWEALCAANVSHKPILLKLSPDLSLEQIQDIGTWAKQAGVSGFVAGNTTTQIQYPHLGPGGVSGKPLASLRQKLIHALQPYGLPIIGCGGIFEAKDGHEALSAGASLLEVYTGLIYRGLSLIRELASLSPDPKTLWPLRTP